LDAVTLPKPEIGLLVHYSYLWASEHVAGAEEGIKNRPCVIVAAARSVEETIVVTVFPITHTAFRPSRRCRTPRPSEKTPWA
jgi:hypothetical protein